ncbi:M48 family metalloprotease [Sneathiella chungangensis]|uniref:M48 family metalloprotease n=1 Tax=Sneathiella chungangensis TaxID=1418234 RepID=A0A845MEL1_9PROT|nr:M48 family metallopeptidase [Sneathiella chungangensis]MZR22408.1 M48 family metalloprotease [Sneathiella chungangensis]
MKKFTSVILLSSFMVGCVSIDDLPYVGAFDQTSKEGKFVEEYDFTAKSYETGDLTTTQDTRNIYLNSLGTIPDDSLRLYAQTILTKIVENGPKVPLQPEIQIGANMNPGAITVKSGTIFLNHSLFDYLENEDQIAFIIAHEYSHLLLQHFTSDLFTTMHPYLVTAADIAVGQAGKNPHSGKGIRLYGTDLMARDVLLPFWSRQNEAEADRLGVDLMVAAGYNPNESLKALTIIDEYEKQFEASFEVERNALEKEILAENHSSKNNDKFNLVESIQTAFKDLQTTVAKEHPDAQERMQDVFEYTEREYSEAAFRDLTKAEFASVVAANQEILDKYKKAFEIRRTLVSEPKLSAAQFAELESTARWTISGSTQNHPYTRQTMSLVREYKGAYELALKNLELTENTDGFLPGPMEMNRIQWLKQTRQNEEAFDRTKEVGEYYDWPLATFREAIELGQVLGKKQEVTGFRLACVAKHPQSRDLCQ